MKDHLRHETERFHSKIVVILFPDQRTTGGTAQFLPHETPRLVRQFSKTTEKLLTRYSQQGFFRVAVVYGDTTTEVFSPFFSRSSFDHIMALPIDFNQWSPDAYQTALRQLPRRCRLVPGGQIVIGGFHAADCVPQALAVMDELGYQGAPDLRLTDQLSFLLVSHGMRHVVREATQEDRLIWEQKKERVYDTVDELLEARSTG